MSTFVNSSVNRADFLVIETGYTSRVTPEFRQIVHEDSDGQVTVVCIKDDLWGKRTGTHWWIDPSINPVDLTDALCRLRKQTRLKDGLLVLHLKNKCTFGALRSFARTMADDDLAYCACFDGIPEEIHTMGHHMGEFVAMKFDCESG